MKTYISLIPVFLISVGMQFLTTPKPQFNLFGFNFVLFPVSVFLFIVIIYSFFKRN